MAFAMVMADGCGMTRMCSYMAELSGQPMNTLRQKYREVYYEKEAKAGVKKRGDKRREIVVEEHFADLLAGVIQRWQGEHTLVLAMDASALGDRLTILSFSVAYRGCCIRVGWTIMPGKQEGSWRPHWERLLRVLAEAVPTAWTVYVMADRGLYAAWLYRAIQANGWHPFLRVKKGLGFRAQGEDAFSAVGERVKKPGREWKGQGEWSEKGDCMEGTLLVRWEEGYEEPIAVVTDLAPSHSKTAWYQLRFWIECDYKDGKRGWFHWEQTKMLNPERASRQWLVLAVVMQKAILLGGALEVQQEQAGQRRRSKSRGHKRPGRPLAPVTKPRGREQSVLLRGMMAWRAAETGGNQPLPKPWLRPEPLPTRLYPVSRVPKSYQLKKQRREEKKRNRARAKTKSKRAERTAEKVARAAEVQARKLARQQRRGEQEAELQARKLARQQQRAEQEKRSPAPQLRSSACLQEPVKASRGGWEKGPEAVLPRPLDNEQKRSRERREEPEKELPMGDACPTHLPTPARPERREPLLRLSQGRLQPPRRLVRTRTRYKEGHGTACGAAP